MSPQELINWLSRTEGQLVAIETSMVEASPHIPVSNAEFHQWARGAANAITSARRQCEWARQSIAKMIAEHVAFEKDAVEREHLKSIADEIDQAERGAS